MAKYIICRDSQSGLSGSVTYLMNNELWSVIKYYAVSLSKEDAESIVRDYSEMSEYSRFKFSIIPRN